MPEEAVPATSSRDQASMADHDLVCARTGPSSGVQLGRQPPPGITLYGSCLLMYNSLCLFIHDTVPVDCCRIFLQRV